MVARRDVRQRTGRDRLFQPGQLQADGVTIHAPRADQRAFGQFAGEPVGLIRTEFDDIHVVPGTFVVRRTALPSFSRRLEDIHVRIDPDERPGGTRSLAVIRLKFDDVDRLPDGDERDTAGSHLVLTHLTEDLDRLRAAPTQDFAPLYGFISHQTSHPCDDPEMATVQLTMPTSPEGHGVEIVVIDTGIWPDWAWKRPRQAARANAIPDEDDLLLSDGSNRKGTGSVRGAPKYLGRAAGHGTFIAGLLRQVVPDAEITVLRSADTDGVIHEADFADRLRSAAQAQPDLVVISCGGTMYRLGDPPRVGDPTRQQEWEWLKPLVLEDAMATLLNSKSKPVVVMSAGNDGSSDHCYPAAFADPNSSAFPKTKDRLVSVAALDDQDWRAYFSNYGSWVTASTLGVRLQSTYVKGREDRRDDPDGRAEVWTGKNPWAMWSGTSFAGPVVAGMIARTLWSLRQSGLQADAAQAWKVLQGQCAPGPDRGATGLVVPAPMVAHA